MARKTLSDDMVSVADNYDERSYEVVKHTVIGKVRIGSGKDHYLDIFASMAMADAREDMNREHATNATYQMMDEIGETTIHINHASHEVLNKVGA